MATNCCILSKNLRWKKWLAFDESQAILLRLLSGSKLAGVCRPASRSRTSTWSFRPSVRRTRESIAALLPTSKERPSLKSLSMWKVSYCFPYILQFYFIFSSSSLHRRMTTVSHEHPGSNLVRQGHWDLEELAHTCDETCCEFES